MKKRTQITLLVVLLQACFSLQAQTLKEAIKLTENEQYDLAGAAFRKLIAAPTATGTEYFYYGENYVLSDDNDSARIIFTQGQAKDPANVLNTIGLAKIEMDNGNAAVGTKMIDDAIAKAGPKNAQAYIEAADALVNFKAKNLDKAQQFLDKAAALDAKNPDIYILYGDIYSERNNGSAAAEQYNRALELDKSSVRSIVSKGKLYKRSTNYEGAAEEYKNAIKIDPNYAPAHRELGEAYIKMGKLEDAKAEYLKYLEISRNNCAARIRYASFLYIGKDYAGALNEIAALRQNCDSTNVTLLRVAAFSYYETKDCAKGLDYIQRLFTVVPETKRLLSDYEYYGKILICMNQDSLGDIMLRKAYSIEPSRIDLLIELGDDYTKLKKYDSAAAVYQEKINFGKNVKSIDYYNLAKSLFFAQRFDAADSAYAKLMELQPTWASGVLWAAKNKFRIEEATKQPGLARPLYEKYVALAEADSANAAKYTEGLKEAYSYLASDTYLRLKDNAKTIMFLRKKMDLITEPSDKKDIQTQIDQINGKK